MRNEPDPLSLNPPEPDPDLPWQTLPAGPELDRLIAERLGHAIYTLTTRPGRRIPSVTTYSILVDGRTVDISRYSKSTDTALSLPIAEGAWFEVHIAWNGHTAARVALPVSSRLAEANPPYQKADAPALAICRAWLAYDDTTHQKDNR